MEARHISSGPPSPPLSRLPDISSLPLSPHQTFDLSPSDLRPLATNNCTATSSTTASTTKLRRLPVLPPLDAPLVVSPTRLWFFSLVYVKVGYSDLERLKTINLEAICTPADYNTRPLDTIYSNFIDALPVLGIGANGELVSFVDPECKLELCDDLEVMSTINLEAICTPADYNTRPLDTIYSNFIDALPVLGIGANGELVSFVDPECKLELCDDLEVMSIAAFVGKGLCGGFGWKKKTRKRNGERHFWISQTSTINLEAICTPADYNTRPLDTIYSNFIDALPVCFIYCACACRVYGVSVGDLEGCECFLLCLDQRFLMHLLLQLLQPVRSKWVSLQDCNSSTTLRFRSTISDGGIGGIQFAAAQLPLLELMDCGMTICEPGKVLFFI
ncbi:hypothetical protein RHMOL_Rhmol13G0282700 [Rhododendron molle]|uniref:Uncharacterized protein n=1 Tax=Rhododendron molle TaxID=49168 RepID=A0ACC0LC56_RHOML|nr:hypothetical protein RHMOL_Rhmol13G0282700 [Rhododendron molle]